MLVLVERRPDRRQFSADELNSSARYAGLSPDVNLVHPSARYRDVNFVPLPGPVTSSAAAAATAAAWNDFKGAATG